MAIAKEKFLSEEFVRHFWPAPAEIYFDSKKEGYPFFQATNGAKQEIVTMAISYLFGGAAYQNYKNADPKIPGSLLGTAPLTLGSVLVVSRTGEILYHHKETMVGDPPNQIFLKQAIKTLGEEGVVSCECPDEDDEESGAGEGNRSFSKDGASEGSRSFFEGEAGAGSRSFFENDKKEESEAGEGSRSFFQDGKK